MSWNLLRSGREPNRVRDAWWEGRSRDTEQGGRWSPASLAGDRTERTEACDLAWQLGE